MKTSYNYLNLILFILLPSFFISSCADDELDRSKNNVSIKNMNPISPETLNFKEFVVINYDYEIVESQGARIWVMPYSNGNIAPKYSYTSSPLIEGKGSREVSITITSGDITKVDQLKIKIATADGSTTIKESFIPVDYTFQTKTD